MNNKDIQIVEKCRLSMEFLSLFNNMKGVIIFLKEPTGRVITGNLLFAQHCGLKDIESVNGISDFDIFSRELAEQYHKDDMEIVKSKEAKFNIIELFPNYLGDLEWYVTNKVPFLDDHGDVMAICGVCQLYESSTHYFRPFSEISESLEYLKDNYCTSLTNQQLAEKSNLSVRQFEKRFQQVLGTTPHKYIIKLRILRACDLLLTTNGTIIEIALELGFYDQSSFTGHFKKLIGLTPLKYIKKHSGH